MTDIPSDILLFELNRVTTKMGYDWVQNNASLLNVLQLYARDLRSELLHRKVIVA